MSLGSDGSLIFGFVPEILITLTVLDLDSGLNTRSEKPRLLGEPVVSAFEISRDGRFVRTKIEAEVIPEQFAQLSYQGVIEHFGGEGASPRRGDVAPQPLTNQISELLRIRSDLRREPGLTLEVVGNLLQAEVPAFVWGPPQCFHRVGMEFLAIVFELTPVCLEFPPRSTRTGYGERLQPLGRGVCHSDLSVGTQWHRPAG